MKKVLDAIRLFFMMPLLLILIVGLVMHSMYIDWREGRVR